MVDNNEEQYEGEEGEYHFSDEQINYDELESSATESKSDSLKNTILSKVSNLSSSRRVIVAGIVFVILMSIVYAMLSPSTNQTQKELAQFAEGTTTAPSQVSTQQAPVETRAPQQVVVAQPIQQVQQPEAVTTLPVATQENAEIKESVSPVVTGYPSQPVQQPGMITQQPAVGTTIPSVAVVAPASQVNAVTDEKIKSLEAQNTAVMKLLQNDYAQKISEFENQNNLVKSKMNDMAKRINRIEKSLDNITKLLKSDISSSKSRGKSDIEVEVVEEKVFAPSVAYTVQAIIPGRAWLKSDAGDTVTVAEGDILREYGRISKIDPYDGVVEINTGHKVIALSYGMTVN